MILTVWEIEGTDEFAEWYDGYSDEEQQAINGAVGKLQEHGPSLGRPLVDTLSHTRLPNLKELRPPGAFIRVLFLIVRANLERVRLLVPTIADGL